MLLGGGGGGDVVACIPGACPCCRGDCVGFSNRGCCATLGFLGFVGGCNAAGWGHSCRARLIHLLYRLWGDVGLGGVCDSACGGSGEYVIPGFGLSIGGLFGGLEPSLAESGREG